MGFEGRAPAMKGRASGRTGCITCRIRKIKCDEAKPSCQKCLSTGRICDGYTTLPFSARDLGAASQRSRQAVATTRDPWAHETRVVLRLLSNSTFRSVTEKRYFQFFRYCTVAGTNLSVNSRFWDRLVLQACDAEPAIKHAVLTLAALHNSAIQRYAPDVAHQHLAYAMKQYQLALGEAKALLATASSQQIDRVLIVCVLFVLYEGMRGDYAASQAHMRSGRAIIAQNRSPGSRSSRRNNAAEIADILVRLDVFALTFSDGVAPYQFSMEDLFRTAPSFCLGPFADTDQARSFLVDLLRWILVLGNYFYYRTADIEAAPTHFDILWQECGRQLSVWRRHWDELLRTDREPEPLLRTNMIELWYTTADAMLQSALAVIETAHDSQYHSFARIVELTESLSSEFSKNPDLASFSLDLGFLMPNFFCAVRCRHPQLRRRAIRILELAPRQEGFWGSIAAAAIATRWVQIEEEGLGDVRMSEDIPESNRVATLEPCIDVQRSSARLHFIFSAAGGSRKADRHETVRWPSEHQTQLLKKWLARRD